MVSWRNLSRRLGSTGLLVALVVAGALTLLLARSAPSDAGPACTKSWAAAVDGHWTNPASWSPAGVPAATDDVCITATGTYTVTVFQNQAANTLQVGSTGAGTATLTVEGVGCSFASSLSVSSTTEVFARGALTLGASGCGGAQSLLTAAGGITNDGSLASLAGTGGARYLRGSVVNRGSFAVSQPTAYDQPGTTLDNQGTVSLPSTLTATSSAVVNRSGAITSSGTGSLVVSSGSFEQRGGKVDGTAPAEIVNSSLQGLGAGSPAAFVVHSSATISGTIAAGQTVSVEGVGCSGNTSATASGDLANAGTLRLTAGGCGGAYALLQGSGLLTNTGTLDVAAGTGGDRYLRMAVRNQGSVRVDQSLSFDQPGTAFDNRGAVTMTQPFSVSAGSFTNTSGSLASSGSGGLHASGASTFVQDDANTTGSSVEIRGASLAFATGSSGSSRFTLHSSVALSGDVPSGATVDIEGLGCSFNTAVTAAGSFANAGTIRLTSGGCGGAYALLAGPGTLTNTGTLDVAVGTTGDRYLRMDVRNQGAMTVEQPLAFDQGGTTLTNEGSMTLTAPVNLSGATLRNLAGSIAASGSGRVNANASSTFQQGDGDTSGNPVVVEGSGLSFLAGSAGSGSFTVHSSSTLAGDVPPGATVVIEGLGCSYNTAVTAAGSFTNAGTIRFTSGGCGATYALLAGSGVLTNTGTIATDAGTGGERYLRMSVRNQGTVSIDQALTFDQGGTTFANEGTVSLTQPMSLAGTTLRNASGSIDGSGAGQVTAASGSTVEQGDGDVTGNPIVVQSSALAFLTPSTGTSSFVAHSSVALSGDIPSGATLSIEGLGCSFNTSVTAAAAFTNAGTIRFTSGGCGATYALLEAPGLITNTGTIDVDAGTGGARYLRASIDNQGTVTVDQPLTVDTGGSTFTNEGTIVLTQPMTTSGVTVRNLAGSIDATGAAALNLNAGSTFVQGDGDTSGNPVITQASDVVFLDPSTGSSQVVMHSSGSITGPVPEGASVTIEGLGCSFNTTVTSTNLINRGTIDLTSGGCGATAATLTVTGTLTNAGTVTAEPGTGGSRTVNADAVVNEGTIHLQTGAPITVNGDLELGASGTVLVDVDGVGATGRVVINGSVDFGGALETNTTYVPAYGTTFPVGTYTSSSGAFDTVGTAGTQYDVTYGATQFSISVLKASATTLASAPAGSTVSGEAVTLTATVAVVAPDTGTPTGSVEFFDDDHSLGSAPLDASQHATLVVTDLLVGTRHLHAEYLGAATFGHSVSSPATRTVEKASTTLALASSPNPSEPGQDVTFTATVGIVAPGAGSPTGTVAFKEGAVVLGTSPVDGVGEAKLVVDSLHVGSHSVVASYSGSSRFGVAVSPAVVQQVTGTSIATTTALVAPTGLVATQSFSLLATVTSVPAGEAITGDVEFREGTQVLGTAPVRSDGAAVLRLARGLGGGTHRIVAAYLGTTTTDPSASAEAVVAVGKARLAFQVTAELDPTQRGVVRFIVVATVAPPASSAPAGAIVLREGGEQVAEGRLVDGRAVLTRCFIPACEPAPTTTTTAPTTTTSTSSSTTSTSTSTTTSTATTTTSSTSTTEPEGPRETTTTIEGSTTTEVPRTTIPGQPVLGVAAAVPAVPVLQVEVAPTSLPASGGALRSARVATRRQLVASYPGDDDFDAYDSDPIPVDVDGDTVTLPDVVVPTTVPNTTPATVPPTAPPTVPPTSTATSTPLVGEGAGGEGTTGGTDPSAGTDSSTNEDGTGAGTDGTVTGEDLAGAPGEPTDGTTATTRPDGPDEGAGESASGAAKGQAGTGTGSGSGDPSGGSGQDDGRPRSLSAEFGRSTISSSVATPKQISTNPRFILENVVLTLFLLLFSVYPAYLINSTLAEHYDEVSSWFGPMHRKVERIRARQGTIPTWVVLGLSGTAGAVLWCLLDPNIGWNMPTLALFVGLFCSAVIISYVYDVTRSGYLRRQYGIESSLRGYPLGVAIATILVLFSRLAGFTPGYLFGVFTALAFVVPIDRRKDGKAIAVASLWILALATVCWFVWVPVAEEASKPHAGFVPLVLDTFLATTWVVGIQTLVFGLMPLRFLDGAKVMAWSRVGWGALYALGMFAFVHSMVRPGTKVDGDTFWTAVVLFVAFTVAALAFWGYFRFRSPRPPAEPSPPAEPPEAKELVDA